MNLDMWFRDDIANVLAGIVTAVRQSGSNQSADWQSGFVAGLSAVCASFGILPDRVVGRGNGECTVTRMEGPYRFDGSRTADGIPRLVRSR